MASSKVPLGRSELPDEPRKVVPVLIITGPAVFRGKIILVPPLELSIRWQRHLADLLTADQITADGDEGLAAFREDGRDDVGRARAPIKPGEDGPLDLERVHQSDAIKRDHRLLTIAEGVAGQKARRAKATQIGDDHPVARLRKQRRNVLHSCECRRAIRAEEDHRTIVGPASTYPTFRTPALICFSEPKDVFVPLLIILFTFLNTTFRCMMTVQRMRTGTLSHINFPVGRLSFSCATEPHKRCISS